MNLELKDMQLPARIRPESPLSDLELMRFCDHSGLRVEREPDGELLIMTPAGFRTSTMNDRISFSLHAWAEADGRGVTTGSDGGYTLPDGSMRAPDAAWVLLERVATLTAEQQEGFAPICPDFVIELRSPGDRLAELQSKMERWISNGAKVAWLIDPKRRTVTIYRAKQEPEELTDPSSVQGDGPVQGFELVMNKVWG